jgi:hypothetical protein
MGVHKTQTFFGRVNPAVPGAVVLVAAAAFAGGFHDVGVGAAIGAVLACLNGVFLSQRVEVAANSANLGIALMVMQLGLLVTATIVGVTTVILIHFSLAMAIASAAGFLVTQLAILATFFFTRARSTRLENVA